MNKFANRQIAIEKTLVIEDMTSKFLKHMIGLDLYQNTKTLDNKSSSISLRAKIDLLTDCGKIDKPTYVNLLHIISIRNQFAHNFECNNFEDLPKFIDGIEKPLLKFCLEPTSSREEDLKSGFLNMLYQAFEFLKKEFQDVTKEFQNDAEKLKIFISQSEQGLLDQWGITGLRNRAIVLNKLREFMEEDDREQTNERIENKIKNFINENPDLK
jgi:hypothetical protein